VWFDTKSMDDRLLCLNMALHVADLANPAKPLKTYLEWTDRVMEEFYGQVRLELERGAHEG